MANVFHAHQNQFLQRWRHVLSDQQRTVLRDIGRCRTAALGTHLERCDRCDYETLPYDSRSCRPACRPGFSHPTALIQPTPPHGLNRLQVTSMLA
ncbi:hypothetical protein ACPOL_3129 [Acidisarcina polymorpha]|uniref:Transposase zinc-binding domain-containing protein n=1 Tax=Acidisarcina polymorpha TaxID=2211140 RepID=A0A2Z5G0X0_9BACT|nr:hypothetical protein ACPOL_3129 [Acidisarcina polymorpha]